MRALTAILLLTVLLAGCASAPRHTPSARPQRATDSKPYDFRSEGNPAPATDEAPVEVDVEEIPLSGESIEVSDAAVPPPADTLAAAPADSTTDGFRIQVFASSDREVAENAARAAEQRMGLAAYTSLEDGMYKVRVGDYAARRDAEAALGTFRSHYYPDAWIVPARVKVAPSP